MAAALSDTTGMMEVDNLALSGVLPASSGIPATVMADLDAADVRLLPYSIPPAPSVRFLLTVLYPCTKG